MASICPENCDIPSGAAADSKVDAWPTQRVNHTTGKPDIKLYLLGDQWVVDSASQNTAFQGGYIPTIQGKLGWMYGLAMYDAPTPNGGWMGIAESPAGDRVMTGSSSGKSIRVRDAKTGPLLLELKEGQAAVSSLVVSADGSHIVTGAGPARVWDARTDRSALDERFRRLWLSRPDPDCHAQRQTELMTEGNTYGAVLHRSFEHRARGSLSFEGGDFDRAWKHFVTAAALMPKPPAPPPIVPAPPTIIPKDNWYGYVGSGSEG